MGWGGLLFFGALSAVPTLILSEGLSTFQPEPADAGEADVKSGGVRGLGV